MQVFHYSTPTTPAGPGSDTVISGSVQVRSEHSFTESAALGEAPIVSITVDDPAAAYDFAGLKRWYVVEDQCPAGDQLIWNGYINDQHITRGDGEIVFPVGAGRQWALELEETNAILGFRIISDVDGNRPAENASERLSWLMNSSDYLTTVGDNGLVNWDGLAGVDMDANDYRGQTAQDVLSDISVQSGFLFFAFYDKDADDDQRISLFFDDPDATTYTSSITISNFADADGTTIYAPYEDAELHRSPSRVAAGVYLPYNGGAVYEYDLTTSYSFGFRDRLAPMASVKTAAKATALADRFLTENDEQTDFITCKIQMAAAHLNDVKRGQVLQARFQHFPTPYNDWFYARVTRKTWAPPQNRTQAFYDVELELSPITPTSTPSGAFNTQLKGVAYSGQPLLPTSTAAGDVLLLVLQGTGNTTKFPAQFRMKNNPSVSPASPEVPPFPDTAGWTVIETACTDYSGQNIGGPCGESYQGPFHGTFPNPSCTGGIRVGIAWRRVLAGEESTTPVAVSTDLSDGSCSAWLYNLGNVSDPSGAAVEKDAHESGNSPTSTLPTLSGNIIGIIGWATASGHSAVVQPSAITANSGSTLVQGNSNVGNHDLPAAANQENWVAVIQRSAGGIMAGRITVVSDYAGLNWCGVAVTIPDNITLPTIPFPANQVLGS